MYTFGLWSLTWCLLLPAIIAAPPAIRVSDDLERESTLMYTADHDVTSLGVIFNIDENLNITILFIESGINEQGERIDFGLYALRNGVKTKLLDNANDITVDNLETAYIATKNGIYVYDKNTNSAQKYGSIVEDVISVAAENGTGIQYYLNKQHQLYKVTENGRKSTIVDAVKNAQGIMTDHSGHLVYYTNDKTFYVYDGNNVTKVEGIADNLEKVRLVKVPIFVEDHVLLYADDKIVYDIMTANATAKVMDQAAAGEHSKVTAVSIDAGVDFYYAKDKKIYEFDLIEKIVQAMYEGLARGLKRELEEFRNSFNSMQQK